MAKKLNLQKIKKQKENKYTADYVREILTKELGLDKTDTVEATVDEIIELVKEAERRKIEDYKKNQEGNTTA